MKTYEVCIVMRIKAESYEDAEKHVKDWFDNLEELPTETIGYYFSSPDEDSNEKHD